MKREAALLGIGLLLGCGIGLSVGMRPVAPAAAEPSAAPADPSAAPVGANAAATTPDDNLVDGSSDSAEPPPPTITNPRAELAALLAAPNPIAQWSEIDRVLTTWAETDPRATLEFVHNAPRFPLRNSALAIPLAALARREPGAVADWLRTNVTESDRRSLADQIVVTIADTHAHEAVLLATTADLRVAPHLLGYTIGRLAATTPEDALALYASLDGNLRQHTAQLLAGTWAEKDPAAALRWCESLRGDPAENAATTGVLLQIAQNSPREAAAALTRLRPPAEAACSALQTIARSEPALAFDCLESLPAEQAAAAARALAETSFGTDPERAVAVLRTHVPAAGLASALRSAWNNWRDSDRPAAEAWADNTTDPLLQAQVAAFRLADAADSDPTALLAAVETLPEAGAERDAIQTALGNVPATDAARWIVAHPQLATRETAVQVARGLTATDAAAAANWAHTLPAGELRDRALAAVAINSIEPAAALASADTLAAIADPQLQLAARFQTFRNLRQQDAAVARAWLETQPVSAELGASWEAIAAIDLDSSINYAGGFCGE
ncbi:MAG TPA: hypothetical protein VK163_09175 [Opitutaceae bacterium]|nr:hypothetical protein [Opitutaceae bacterium]